MNDDFLKKAGGGTYWRELLERIRDIRSSEKVFYRQVLDLYATSVDYDPRTPESQEFFKIVQNKIHFAAHGHTAAEVIAGRANAEMPFMGLTVFTGEQPTKSDEHRKKLFDRGRACNAKPHGICVFRHCRTSRHAAQTNAHEGLDCRTG
jgi:hypothetical protein